MLVRIVLLVSVLFFSGCAMVPDSLEVPEGTELISYSTAVTSGTNAQGKKARWGGVIVGVENKPNKTFIEVVHFPLNSYGKPNTSEETIGRFKVQIDGFVDPIVFEKGRSATFLGTLLPPTSGMVGEQPYIYPTLLVDDYHMWRKRQVYDVTMYHFDYYSGWYSPFYYPGPWRYPGFTRMRVTRYGDSPAKARLPNPVSTRSHTRVVNPTSSKATKQRIP